MTLASSIIAKARIVSYNSRIIIYSFIVLATVIKILNYNHTAITIINYDRKTFIVQATGKILQRQTLYKHTENALVNSQTCQLFCFWYYKGGAMGSPILLAKWTGCQCSLCTFGGRSHKTFLA
jgi:hypothetical protein